MGYQNIGYDKSGWMMNIAVQFANVASEDGSFTIGESFFNGTATEGDYIYTLDTGYWDLNQFDKQGVDLGWMLYPANGDEAEQFKEIKQSKGSFLYYQPTSAVNVPEVIVSGQVANLGEQSVVFDLENEDEQTVFELVNPFPIATTWGDLNTFTVEGDFIYALDTVVWDLNQYDRQPDGHGWALYPANGGDTEYFTDESAIALKAGEAAYYAPQKTTTWTVSL